MNNEIADEMAGEMPVMHDFYLAGSSCEFVLVSEGDHNLDHRLPINPVVGEKSHPALGLADEANQICEVEAIFRSDKQMAFNPGQVPQDITDAQRKDAMDKVKEVDRKAVDGNLEDIINTGIKKGNFVLWHIRKRGGKKDEKTGRKPIQAAKLIWMPHAVNSSLEEFVSFFALKYGESDEKAGAVVFKERALQSEVIVQRSKMSPTVKAAGQKRGKFRS